MRALGVDLGERRIGVAVSDATGTLASPVEVVARARDAAGDWAALVRIAREWEATVIVVGVPVSLDGVEREPAVRARASADEIAGTSGLPVETWDERMTTVAAGRKLSAGGTRARARKSRIDAAAAAEMLQGWLDARAAGSFPPAPVARARARRN